MTRRLLALLLIGVVSLAGLALAQEPAAKDEPPVRLKKKKPRGEDKPMVDPDKPDEKKDDKKDEKKEDKKAEPRESEPVTPQEEEKEVLERVVKNVHNVGERLAKNDLGEATQQTQRDILKDLESLIQRNENPPQGGGQQDQNQDGGGGSADQDNKDQQGGGGQQDQKQKGSGQKSQGKSSGGQKSKGSGGQNSGAGQKNQNKQGGGSSGTKPGAGSKSGTQQRPGGSKPSGDKRAGKDGKDGDKPGGRNGTGGTGGAGGDKDDHARNKSADVYKAEWGHLPQTLRAQMDAYSNPQPFIPKYDDLIKQYYRTIAEQGRRKGE
jgi:hypothetical protein